MKEELLHKYIRKEVNPEEKKIVLDWLKNSKENQKQYNLIKANYVAGSLKKIKTPHNHIAFNIFKQKQKKRSHSRYISYAVIIILLVSTTFIIYQNWSNLPQNFINKNTPETLIVNTQNIEKREIVLPDGSTVKLNVGSYLEYPETFKSNIRTVTLVGEGLFDIVHDSLRPFIVKTQDFDVKVLGTTFNVKSYLNDIQTETTLITGKVELLREEETPILLAPSQKAIFYKTENKIEIGEVKSEDVIAWQKGTLVFNSTPMEQVVLDLERKYNVKITINSSKLLTYEYTGTFDNLTLDESLQLLMISSPIIYKIENKEITIDMRK
ncbi:FecR family protein [Abyssalbus ytuae]|uniref:DUF4974 domain-containing protein n=1 Tax=Abyssalbus ytuae TaxID=2926907 RepID=A0A9E7A027_9FLAO|nr:FecR domain-containing protein [Abyssalbus ytuae]UOB17136.1 DUF4974 domain-containing protein [Abyssalbus ytuae]